MADFNYGITDSQDFETIPNRSILDEKPLPGETWAQFLQRTKLYAKLSTPEQMQAAEDEFKITQLGQSQESKSRAILDEQSGLQKTRLNELAALLAQQQGSQFNRDIPGIANTAQGKGFLETSGFGNALADRYSDLTEKTSLELAKQGLTDRDLQIQGLGKVGTDRNAIDIAGLERTFSNEDLSRSEKLSRELARLGVVNPQSGETSADKFQKYTTGGAALIGVGKGAKAGGNSLAGNSEAADAWSDSAIYG